MKKLWFVVSVAGALLATSAQATLVTETSVSPGTIVSITTSDGGFNGSGLAGIYNLTVDGVATPSFCIDVFRLSPPAGTTYSYASLENAPLNPAGPMGTAAATDIEKLWAAYFSGATTANEAAALQAAVWLDIASYVGYTVTVNGNNPLDPVYSRALQMLGSLGSLTAQADLRALVNGTYQNYVVPVPEPTTMIAGALLLLPFGASAMRILRRNRA